MRRTLATLSPDDRAILIMDGVLNMPGAEIAASWASRARRPTRGSSGRGRASWHGMLKSRTRYKKEEDRRSMDSTGTPHGDKRATGWTTDDVPRLIRDDVPRLIRDAYPDGPDAEEPPGQAELRAWVAREMRRRLRLDRLWVLAVALPLTGLVLRRSFQAGGPVAPAVGGGVVGALTVVVLRYMLRAKP